MNVEAAKQTVVEYYAKVDEVAAGGFLTWEADLSRYWGSPDLVESLSTGLQSAASMGLRGDGETVLSDIVVLSYTPDPTGSGFEQARLSFCEDNSAVSLFMPDGAMLPKTLPPRYVTTVDMQRSVDFWALTSIDSSSETPC